MSTHATNTDAILAAIFDPQITPADLPGRTGLSLVQLARWLKANAQTVNEVREFLTQRAALIGARLHTASLGALDRVVRECTDLERVRKAASTILRSLKAPTNPTRERGAPCANEHASRSTIEAQCSKGVSHTSTPCGTASTPNAHQPRPSPAERLAAIRLAKLAERPMAPAT